MTSGSARSHTRLRGSPEGRQMLARRVGSTMSPKAAAKILDQLRGLGLDAGSRPAELVAALLGLDPVRTNEELADAVPGIAGPEVVARVRANLAAGRPPGHRLPAPATDETSPDSARNGVLPASEPSPRAMPPENPSAEAPPEREPLTAAALTRHMPQFRVVAADGTVTEHASYREASVHRYRCGGRLEVLQP